MKAGPIILSLIGLALLAFLFFSPVTPPVEQTAEVTEETPAHDTAAHDHDPDAQVEEALRMLESREVPPMEAILKIREVAENHPGNVKANFTLGALSLQTGQYENAVERFSTVTEQQADNGQVWRLMAEAQLRTGDTASARESFNKALQLVDPETRAKFENELPELSIN